MKRIIKSLYQVIEDIKRKNEERRIQELREEAICNVNIRPIINNGKEGYGLFVCGNLVEEYSEAGEAAMLKMLELRKFYFDLWKPTSAYKLL